MRYLIALSIGLLVLSAAVPAFAGGDAVKSDNEMHDWAVEQSNTLDRNWEDAVNRSSGGRSTMMTPVYNGRSRIRRRQGSRNVSGLSSRIIPGASSRTWNNQVNSNKFINRGIRSNYFSLSTRKRSGASRGLNMPKNPAGARMKGMRRAPFNSSRNNSSFTTSNRTFRKSPRMGSRRGGSSRTRSTSSSSGRIGASRSRRTR